MRSKLAIASALALLSACATPKTNVPPKTWVKTDGSSLSQAEFSAARRQCEGRIESELSTGPRFDHIQWTAKIMNCMKEHGIEQR